MSSLVEAGRCEGAVLRPLLSVEERQGAARLVAEGDAVQWADPRWRRELAAWMRPRRRGDGLPVPTLTAPVVRAVVRLFNMGGGVGSKDQRLVETSPLLAVLGTEGDTVRDWLTAGQALQRVLLLACRNGLQASYLNQPIQVAALRPKLQSVVGEEFPQILMRLGSSVEASPAVPRRSLEEVTQKG